MNAPVAQLVDATDLKSVCYEFESRPEYLFVVIENPVRNTVCFYYERGFRIRDHTRDTGDKFQMYEGKDPCSSYDTDCTFRLVVSGDTISYCTGQDLVNKYFADLL